MARVRNIITIVAVLITTVLCTVQSAFAQPAPPPDVPGPGTPAAPFIAHVASNGMSWGSVVLTAVASAAVAACVTALWHTYRSHHRLANQPAIA